MEISNEVKAKVFAQYLGQKVYIGGKKYVLGALTTTDRKNVDLFYACDNVSQMLLRPLSEITDEEIKELVKIFLNKEPSVFSIERVDKDFIIAQYNLVETPGEKFSQIQMTLVINGERIENVWNYRYPKGTAGSREDHGHINMCYQYLQSKGYDLPSWYLGGKTLKEAGLAIYEGRRSREDI